MSRSAVALAVYVATTSLLIVSVQVAVLPPLLMTGLPQVVLIEVGAGVTLGVTESKTTGLAPAGIAFTVTVKTCWWVITLVALGGPIVMKASTQVLTALTLSPGRLSPVVLVMDTPRTLSVVLGLTVVWPALVEVIDTEQLPPVVVQVWMPPSKGALAPLVFGTVKVT